jgi:DNA-binding NarL/FixJ family response regulator
MSSEGLKCVLLADRHHGLSEGVRGLLETEFAVVVMVADERSLIEGAKRLQPTLAVADLSLARGESLKWIADLHSDNPALKVIVLSVHDEPCACRAAMAAGVSAFVLKRDIATELLQAVAAAMGGKHYLSSGALARLSPAEGQRMLEPSEAADPSEPSERKENV